MGIVSFSSSLAINKDEFEFLEVHKKNVELNTEDCYELVLHYSGKERCLFSSSSNERCRLAYYWYLYLISDTQGNLSEFTQRDRQWFSALLVDFETNINMKIDIENTNSIVVKNTMFDLLEEYKEEIREYVLSGRYH